MTDHSLSLSRDINASAATVWRCLTEPALLAKWFAPQPVKITKAVIDPVPGGTFHVVMDVPGMGEMDGGAGCVLDVVRGQRLVWTSALAPGFCPNDPPADGEFHFTAIFTLAPIDPGRTRYTATALHANAAAREAHAAMGFDSGWGTAADQLGTLAAGLAPQ